MTSQNVTLNQPHRSLFSRILLEISFALLGLSLVFSALQLNREMSVINESFKIQSRLAIESSLHALNFTLKRTSPDASPADYERLIDTLVKNHPNIRISLYDAFEKELLFNSSQDTWDEGDQEGLEKAFLESSENNRSYTVEIRKSYREIRAYAPVKDGKSEMRWISRIILPLPGIAKALQSSYISLTVMIFFIFLAGLVLSIRLSSSIVKPIQVLNDATQEIVSGRLGKHVRVNINTGDELESLADTFDKMSDTIKAMNERAADANPLTKLPGNQLIFQELKTRIYDKQKFVLFHVDIDRFKVFNDHFGLGKGDEAIQRTAELLNSCVRDAGAEDDFVGHQGGDDFVIITRPQKAENLAQTIIRRFDSEVISALYTEEDIQRGYTMQIDRRRLAETGEERMAKFPFIALSLAGVTNSKSEFVDYFDCMNKAVDVKKAVKKQIESSYLIQE